MSDSEEHRARGGVRIARWILGLSLVPGCLLALFTARVDIRYMGVAILLAALGAGIGWLAPRLVGARAAERGLLVLASLNLVLLAPELALRSSGFRYESGIEFGYPRPTHFVALEPHPEFFWTLRPGSEGVNSWGFPGAEIALPKRAGVQRIAVFGDSCSQTGYPEELERLLDEGAAAGDARTEVIRLAVSGYSSHQGRRIAERHAARLEADLALVYFGWNDHWRAWGEPDHEKRIALPEGRLGATHALLLRSLRVIGFAQWLRDGLAGERRERSGGVRVPPDRYRENLAAIVDVLRGAGSDVVLLTAPTSYARLGVPYYVVESGLSESAERAVLLHREYNEIVRRVAAERHVGLVDLASRAERLPDQGLREFFLLDGIHFTPRGATWIAETIADHLSARRH